MELRHPRSHRVLSTVNSRKKSVRTTLLESTTLDVRQEVTESLGGRSPDELYEEATASYGAPLERLARAYEADPETRRDLLQEIHLAL